jgi:hypothetical protein
VTSQASTGEAYEEGRPSAAPLQETARWRPVVAPGAVVPAPEPAYVGFRRIPPEIPRLSDEPPDFVLADELRRLLPRVDTEAVKGVLHVRPDGVG